LLAAPVVVRYFVRTVAGSVEETNRLLDLVGDPSSLVGGGSTGGRIIAIAAKEIGDQLHYGENY
jgi:hypothetical protein